MTFQAPIADIVFTMRDIAGLDEAVLGDVTMDMVEAVMAGAGRFAEAELAPLNRVGDREGVRIAEDGIVTARGWKEAYRRFAAAGWNGISAPEMWGGQGLPVVVEMAAQELWNAGSTAFATGPMLTTGAVTALDAHASEALKEAYLPKLVSGAWMATMNLTEPQAGSDLGALATRAERTGDGSYRISGQKIFITYGEHDLTENIVHLVLARLPDAPAGTHGISMFLVPKFLVGPDGTLKQRNSVRAVGIEHKLGLHGAPTCTMLYDKAVGYLVGEENRGLACMFTMMNIARLSVGIQAVGVAERACQDALAYARERRQGRAPGWTGNGMSPIVEHPDVQSMLLRMKALTAASRAICYACAHAIDMSTRGAEAHPTDWKARAALLTPIAKAFSTDAGIEVASLGIQVHGGAGYIEETGAAQHLRDVRVFAIYEGTNGIQAIDLVSRKLVPDEGRAVRHLVEDLHAVVDQARTTNDAVLRAVGLRLSTAIEDLDVATAHLVTAWQAGRKREVLARATAYLRLFALVLGAGLLTKGAIGARSDDGHGEIAVAIARHFAETMLGESAGLRRSVTSASEDAEAAAALFAAPGNRT